MSRYWRTWGDHAKAHLEDGFPDVFCVSDRNLLLNGCQPKWKVAWGAASRRDLLLHNQSSVSEALVASLRATNQLPRPIAYIVGERAGAETHLTRAILVVGEIPALHSKRAGRSYQRGVVLRKIEVW